MTSAATNNTTDTKARGFGLLPCPRCGEGEATITLYLGGLDTLHCQDCDEEFTVKDVQSFIERWARVLAWIDNAPLG